MSNLNNPFPGLRPFEMQEKYLFFGREEQTVELLKRLGQSRFLAVVGTSGSGKSSLVRAGLLPELHGGTMTDAGSSWEIAVMRPGGDPLTNLARALEDSGIHDTEEDDYYRHLRAMLGRSTMGLIETVAQSNLKATDNLLVVVDQFEEIFRFRHGSRKHAEEAANFINLILEASSQKDRSIFVIITMRSDFLGDCSQFRGLAEAVNEGEYLIPRLNRKSRRLAIEGPVKVGGKQIEARLVQQLLNDIGDDPDQLPILQHALMRTWEYHEKSGGDGSLDLDHYEATGGMREALSRHADEVFEELSTDEERKHCEKIFKALTERVSEGRGIRRPMHMSELAEVVGVDEPRTLVPIIDAFRASGRTFIMPPQTIELESKVVIDISHESLMRVWTRLVSWVDEEAQSARIYRRLADTALLYKENKAGLYRDPDLQIAMSWKQHNSPNQAWADRYYAGFNGAMVFLEESHETSIADEKAREEARQRELEQARRLAEEERRSKSLWQKLVWTFGLAVLAITIGLIFIINSRAEIRDNLSRFSLNEANRLVSEERADEAIALLSNTYKENPKFIPAATRLMSLLEFTGFPNKIEELYKYGGDIQFSRSRQRMVKINGKRDLAYFTGVKDDLFEVKLISLKDLNVIYSYSSTNRIYGVNLSKDGAYFSHAINRNRSFRRRSNRRSSGMHELTIYNTKLNTTNVQTNPKLGSRIRFSNNGKLIVNFSQIGGVYLLDNKSFSIIHGFKVSTNEVQIVDLEVSPDGKKIATAFTDNGRSKIIIYDVNNLTNIITIDYNFIPNFGTLEYTKNGKNLSFTSSGSGKDQSGYYRVCDLLELDYNANQYEKENLRAGLTGSSLPPLITYNDSLIITRSSKGGLAIKNHPGGSFKDLRGHSDVITGLDISPDQSLIISGSKDKTLRFWNSGDGSPAASPITFPVGIDDVKFNFLGNGVYVALSDGSINKIHLPIKRGKVLGFRRKVQNNEITSYDSTLERFVSIGDKEMVIWNLNQDLLIKSNHLSVAHLNLTNQLDGKIDWKNNTALLTYMDSETNNNFIALNLKTGEVVNKFKLNQEEIFDEIGDENELACVFVDTNRLQVIRLTDQRKIGQVIEVQKDMSNVRFTAEDKLLFIQGTGGGIFYNFVEGKQVGPTLERGRYYRRPIYLQTKQKLLIYPYNGDFVSIWKIGTDKIENKKLEIGQIVQSISVNKLESLVAIVEGTDVSIWDISTKDKKGGSLHHELQVEAVAFHPIDDNYVFTIMYGGVLYGWDLKEQNIYLGPLSLNSGGRTLLEFNKTADKLFLSSFSSLSYQIPISINYNYPDWLPELATAFVGFENTQSNAYKFYTVEERNKIFNQYRNQTDNGDIVVRIRNLIEFDEERKNIRNSPGKMMDRALRMSQIVDRQVFINKRIDYLLNQSNVIESLDPTVIYTRAQIFKNLNEPQKALASIDKAIEVDTGNAEYLDFRKTLLQNN